MEPVEVWPNSHTTAYHLGPPLVADLDLQRKQGLWSLCSPHPITTPSLPQGLSSGEHIHKPIATNSPASQDAWVSSRVKNRLGESSPYTIPLCLGHAISTHHPSGSYRSFNATPFMSSPSLASSGNPALTPPTRNELSISGVL